MNYNAKKFCHSRMVVGCVVKCEVPRLSFPIRMPKVTILYLFNYVIFKLKGNAVTMFILALRSCWLISDITIFVQKY